MKRATALSTALMAGATLALLPAASAIAAPTNDHASCVAVVTNNPDFGPPGRAHQFGINGHIVSFVAHSAHDDCYAFLAQLPPG